MGSSAADSQLATARSQLRFQSAAFSSSQQTATHKNRFWIKTIKQPTTGRKKTTSKYHQNKRRTFSKF